MPAIASQVLMKPIAIMSDPQRSVMVPRCRRGPSFLTMMVDGIWKTMYVGKKTRVMIFFLVLAGFQL